MGLSSQGRELQQYWMQLFRTSPYLFRECHFVFRCPHKLDCTRDKDVARWEKVAEKIFFKIWTSASGGDDKFIIFYDLAYYHLQNCGISWQRDMFVGLSIIVSSPNQTYLKEL